MTLTDRFAANLLAARTARGMTQPDFAALVGISKSYVSMLERGQRMPPLDVIERIASALSMDEPLLLLQRVR